MKSRSRIIRCLFALVVLAGCASARITKHQIYVMGNIPRPDRILVYDFAAAPDDVPVGPARVAQYSGKGAPNV
jgi:hypothetical protein